MRRNEQWTGYQQTSAMMWTSIPSMIRVREAAMASGTSSGAARPQTAGDAKGADIDLVRVIDAQGEWNEHTRQLLAALVECLQTLREDWTDAHARLREDMSHRLSALVRELRTRTDTAVTQAKQPADTSTRASRERVPAHHRQTSIDQRRETADMKVAVVHRGDEIRRARRRGRPLRRTARSPAVDWRRRGSGGRAHRRVDLRYGARLTTTDVTTSIFDNTTWSSRRRLPPTCFVIPVISRISFTRFASSATGSRANSAMALPI